MREARRDEFRPIARRENEGDAPPGEDVRYWKNQLAGQMQETHATLTLDPLPAVKGDFLALAMLFRCLIENACKFRGEAAPCIHVGAVQQGSEWILSVRDNGVGFAPEYRDRIFRPFERLNGKRYPGSGLGLPLAKRIVERHGGRMWAESKPGEGCVCWFSLPVG